MNSFCTFFRLAIPTLCATGLLAAQASAMPLAPVTTLSDGADLVMTVASDCYAVGQQGELLVSPDGGESWGRCTTTTKLNFLGVSASSAGEVVISGVRVMYRSVNGGMTWDSVRDGDATTDWYQSVRTEPASGKIFAVGHSGRIIRIGT